MLYLIRTEYAVEMYTTYGIPPDMLERWIEGIYKLCKTRQEKARSVVEDKRRK
jgi:alanyl-tRNA synthetase